MDEKELTEAEREQVRRALGEPAVESAAASRGRVAAWFAETAPLVQWDTVPSPLGTIYVAARSGRLCNVDFRIDEAGFLAKLDPLARTERDAEALAPITEQLRRYFQDPKIPLEVPVDFSGVTPFQRRVLTVVRRIPVGAVWTYGQVAGAVDRPGASRAVGQALGRNPMPIVIPCHRVVARDGSLGGYSGGGGLTSKRLLLNLEGAPVHGA